MPAIPAESIHEQIEEALRVLLAGIVAGANYWNTFESSTAKVARCSFYRDADLVAAYEQIVLIRPGIETVRELSSGDAISGGGLRGEMETFVEINKRFEKGTENPFEATAPTRATLVNRVIRDVLRRVCLDGITLAPVLGAGTPTVNVIQESLVIDRDQFMEKWARAELRFVISYDFMAATP